MTKHYKREAKKKISQKIEKKSEEGVIPILAFCTENKDIREKKGE